MTRSYKSLPGSLFLAPIHCVFPQSPTFKTPFPTPFPKNKGTYRKVHMFHAFWWKKLTRCIKTSVLRCRFSQPVQWFSLQQMLGAGPSQHSFSMGLLGRKTLHWLAKTTAWNASFNASCLVFPPGCLKHLYFSVGTIIFWKGRWGRVLNVGDCGTSG